MLACGPKVTPFEWQLPKHFPQPPVPADNPLTIEKVELGRRLFYDQRLSVNGTMSCASCHQQDKAFTDGKARAVGATLEVHPRGSMSLTNVAYNSRLAWANPLLDRLEHQAMLPMFGEEPVEMGLAGREQQMLSMLRADPTYRELFGAAWPKQPELVSVERVVQAIASFERSLVSANSPYDRYVEGQASALSESAQRGMDLFFSERTECFHCHGNFNFADSVTHQGAVAPEVAFHNTALYNIDGEGAYPASNRGIAEISGLARDMGRFRAPTLRNISVTAPYMHDGSVATLEEVFEHYARGGRLITEGPNQGAGSESPLKSEFLMGFVLTPAERKDMAAFLESLTDEAFLTDPRFADPW